MDVIQSLKWRYAIKKFDVEKELSESQINILKEAFNLTATSYGLQPIKMLVIKNKKIQKKLVEHSWNQIKVFEASHVLVICVPRKYIPRDIKNYISLVTQIRNISSETLDSYKEFLISEIKNKTQEELYIWNKNQAYIALGNLLTVCALEKIDSCPMEGFESEKYDEVLNLHKQNLTSVLVMPVGYRASDDFTKDLAKVRKKTSESVIDII